MTGPRQRRHHHHARGSRRRRARAHARELGETYRTLLGHFRHEIGHYYWDRLVRDGDAARRVAAPPSATSRRTTPQALQAHYESGPPADWRDAFVSAYASAHPWEDFAETWAHYLHIVDTLETARAFGMSTHRPATRGDDARRRGRLRSLSRAPDARRLIEAWLPLTVAVNSLNRAMGQPDLYPFVLSPPAIDKLGFVHDLVHAT